MYVGSSSSPTRGAKESPDLIVLLSADSIQFPTYEVFTLEECGCEPTSDIHKNWPVFANPVV
jgi:hypothetical protein